MSKLEQLIAELCPNGVEFVKLGELCDIANNGVDKKVVENEKSVSLLNYMDVYRNRYIKKDTLSMKVTASDNKINSCDIRQGDILITPTSETIDDIGHSSVAIENIEEACYSYHIMRLRLKNHQMITSYFLNYLFASNILQKQILKLATGLTRFGLSKGNWEKLSIPLPHKDVQEEIVRILDDFTNVTSELTTKLTAELTARKQQYEYYRDSLLTFGDDVPLVPLGEIQTEMYRGAGIKRDEITEHGIPCVRYGEIYTTYNIWFDNCVSNTKSGTKTFEHGDVLFAITGESVEDIAKSCVYMGNDKCLAGGDIVVMKHKQTPKYMAYVLFTTNAKIQKSKGKIKSKVVHSSVPALKAIKIPLPSPTEQERIVKILDHYDNLYKDVSEKLSVEIEKRKQQYEYYRNKLLTFKEVSHE